MLRRLHLLLFLLFVLLLPRLLQHVVDHVVPVRHLQVGASSKPLRRLRDLRRTAEKGQSQTGLDCTSCVVHRENLGRLRVFISRCDSQTHYYLTVFCQEFSDASKQTQNGANCEWRITAEHCPLTYVTDVILEHCEKQLEIAHPIAMQYIKGTLRA